MSLKILYFLLASMNCYSFYKMLRAEQHMLVAMKKAEMQMPLHEKILNVVIKILIAAVTAILFYIALK